MLLSYLWSWRASHLAFEESISSLSKARVPKDLFKDRRRRTLHFHSHLQRRLLKDSLSQLPWSVASAKNLEHRVLTLSSPPASCNCAGQARLDPLYLAPAHRADQQQKAALAAAGIFPLATPRTRCCCCRCNSIGAYCLLSVLPETLPPFCSKSSSSQSTGVRP